MSQSAYAFLDERRRRRIYTPPDEPPDDAGVPWLPHAESMTVKATVVTGKKGRRAEGVPGGLFLSVRDRCVSGHTQSKEGKMAFASSSDPYYAVAERLVPPIASVHKSSTG